MAKKKETKKKQSPQLHKAYDVSGGSVKKKNRSCPKCGPGVFMAKHKDRETCGRCAYTEFSGKDKK